MKSLAIQTVLLVLVAASSVSAQEIGFIEKFALAEDRQEILKTLIPGSQDYYYFHCLHYLNTQQFDKTDELLSEWIKRYKSTPQITEIQNRLSLLTYERNPEKTLEFLRSRLGLSFNHQQDVLGADPRLPTKLNPQLVSREEFVKRATANRRDLSGFEDRALEWMIGQRLTPTQRRNLLQRLQRPDVEGLVETVAGDLQTPGSGGFGSLPIHNRLLKNQLEELLKLMPDLRNNSRFVTAYATRLQPADLDGWQYDDAKKTAYLDRMWAFVSTLSSVHNSLKAHVLYHRLDFDRTRSVYDKDRFMTYLKLPRGVRYVNPKYLQLPEHRRVAANLGQNFRNVTLFRAVGDDQPLVRAYLHHFFVDEAAFDAYLPYLADSYVKEQFAEAKLVHGLGNAERWFSLLPPGKFQSLRDRVDLDFAITNKNQFAADEKVQLDVYVKNVENLIVKVYEINSQNYYRSRGREVGVDIELDGLVANHETPHRYEEPPIRRVKRRFEFPMIDKRGVYVVDFIGNGTNSRALIRKGRLRKLLRTTSSGQQFTVLDENNKRVKKPALWMSGRSYAADENGNISVPFSTRPGRQTIVLSDGDFHWLDSFTHQSESYQLQAGIHIDRESLLAGRKAKIAIRPSLRINGNSALLGHLENVVLQIVSTNRDGTVTTKEVKDFKLNDIEESSYDIQVPSRLTSISVTLKAQVQSVSQNKKIDLSASRKFDLNGIDATDRVDDVHLAKLGDRFYLELAGKTGEVKSKRPVAVRVKHRDFKDPLVVTMQTDDSGRIDLGPLPQIASLNATPVGGRAKVWPIPQDSYTFRRVVYATAGEEIALPYTGTAKKANRSEISFLETRGGVYARDRFDSVTVEGGLLKIRGLSEGRYQLRLKDPNADINVHVLPGSAQDGFVLTPHRIAELRGQDAVQISAIEFDQDEITVNLDNANSASRVHLIATRYLPEYDAFNSFAAVRDLESGAWFEAPRLSLYAAGRQLGDEYRYIIDRQYAKKYPGNLLDQPGLLLHPWALRKTDAENEVVKQPSAFAPTAEAPASESRSRGGKRRQSSSSVAYANLDFLAKSSPLMLNARPDDKGRIRIKRESLQGRQYLTVVAVDDTATARRSVALPTWKSDFADLRLLVGLHPEKHFIQQKQISVLKPKQSLAIEDFASSRFESYGGLNAVYDLLSTLNPDANLRKFGFIRQWPTLSDERKAELYSEFACHELNFFLFKKDRKFFDNVIRGHLANKHHKTFVDHWLLGHDLSGYQNSWAYSRLNTVERILLVQGNAETRKLGARRAADLYDMLPPAAAKFSRLYESALSVNGLDDNLAMPALAKLAPKPKGGELARKSSMRFGGRGITAGKGLKRDENRNGVMEEEEAKLGLETLDLAEKLYDKKSKANRDAVARGLTESLKSELGRRGRYRQLYVKLDQTQEWAENNYYQIPIEQQNANLIKINRFWRDYAAADPNQPFLSTAFTEATSCFSEMMFALSVLDLPLENVEPKTTIKEHTAVLSTTSPAIVFHEEFKQVQPEGKNTTILVSQNFFRKGDQYRVVDGQRTDKFVSDEFLKHTVYGCQIVVTNPTSTPQKLDVLVQTPVGSMPVSGGRRTQSLPVELKPYHAETLVYYFYFPAAGEFEHFPVHVSKEANLLAFTKPRQMNVVDEPTKVDRSSWTYISQYGSNQDVLKFLEQNNPHRVNLNKIAFRMKDKGFFESSLKLLSDLGVYNHTLWSYGIKHNKVSAIREFLQNSNSFVAQCGLVLDSPLLSIDPVERRSFQFLEYRPLVNPRSHQLGGQRTILNARLRNQFQMFLKTLSYQREISHSQEMGVVYYMLSQGRIGEAVDHFTRIDRKQIDTKLQYDYTSLYLDFFSADLDRASETAKRYQTYPVNRWRLLFQRAGNQLREIRGADVQVADNQSREETQEKLASTQPSFDFKVESKEIKLGYENLDEVTLNFYEMDVELMFSRNPFVQQYSDQFSFIRPNRTQHVNLNTDQTSKVISLPKDLHNKNVLVEVVGSGRSKTQVYYSNSLSSKFYEDYGQLRITSGPKNRALPGVYVKVYARLNNGQVKFYKDGYTDLRGRFDYSSLNSDDLNQVSRFSMLILSEKNGAIVSEAAPPKQ